MTAVLFAIWIVILHARAGAMNIHRSLVEMSRCGGAGPLGAVIKIHFRAAWPETLGVVRIGVIRAVKGVIVGQLLMSVVGVGARFELYSNDNLIAELWAVPFAMAFIYSEFLANLVRKVAYYAASR
jgi:NitT/TauT family transport system permease protein